MLIAEIDDYYEASYITGPTHNTLQLSLTSVGATELAGIAVLPSRGDCTHGTLDPNAIFSAIQEGVTQANRILHTSYQINRAGYVANDTPKYVVYHILAYRMTIHHHGVNLCNQAQVEERKAFEIITSKNINENLWLLKGRAWLDISLNDVLFTIAHNATEVNEVVWLVTYGHDVETLSRMMTGAIYVQSRFNHTIVPAVFLYR